MRDDFAIFILTHGRPNKQLTLDMLKRTGYSGQYYLVLDNQDSTLDEYVKNYGNDRIIVFDKSAFVEQTDTGNSNPVLGCGVYARNAIEYIAKGMGYKYFAQADDDIVNLRIRYPENKKVRTHCIYDLDSILYYYITYLSCTQFAYIGFGNQPAYIGGMSVFESAENINYPYAFMIRNGDIKVDWKMNFSDDYVTPLLLSIRGNHCMQIPFVQVDESPVAKTDGGMADSYKNETELSLAFYIKMCCPSAVTIKLTETGIKLQRHGRKLKPKILSGGYKK